MKKYIVFAGHDHYPSGGMGDVRGSFDTLEECRVVTDKKSRFGHRYYDWHHIVDRDTWEELERHE